MSLSPLTRRRLASFRASPRGYWSLWIFLVLFVLSLAADLLANDRPLLVRHEGHFYVPVLRAYPETAFGGQLPTEAAYRDPYVRQFIEAIDGGQYDAAYQSWDAEGRYTLKDFLQDWGKDGYYTKGMHEAKVVDSNGQGTAVVVYLGIDSLKSPVALRVDKDTLKISFSPVSKYPSP